MSNTDYEIIPDSELNIETLLNSNKILLAESEIKSYKNTPWTWYTISGESPESIWYANVNSGSSIQNTNSQKNKINMLIDMGYSAFDDVITIDNTVKKALKHNKDNAIPITELTISDLKMQSKIEHINKLSNFIGMPQIINLNAYNNKAISKKDIIDAVFECKLTGWDIAQICYTKIEELDKNKEEINSINIEQLQQDSKFSKITDYAIKMGAVRSFLKGSYINYIESGKKAKFPSDIDVSIILKNLNKFEYLQIIQEESKIEDIEIYPLIIAYCHKEAHAFFDLDVNSKSRIIYNNSAYNNSLNRNAINNNILHTTNHPEKMIRVIGNAGINKIRALALNEEHIKELCQSSHAHRKIYSAIRMPEIFYRRIKEYNRGIIINKPNEYSSKFYPTMPFSEIQKLLMQSSIELSKMNIALNEYIINQ